MIEALVRFDSENAVELRTQFYELPDRNPRHHALLCAAAVWSWSLFDKPIVLTSIYRPQDTGSVHSLWRGTDIRIYHPQRMVVDEDEAGLEIWEAHELAARLNESFQYRKNDGSVSAVAIVHGANMDCHLHVQTPSGQRWRA